jgi:Protein of unknown function (DUF3800)
VRDEHQDDCWARWREVLQSARWPETDEVKWDGLAGGRSRQPRDLRLVDALFRALGALPVTCLAVVIKTDAARKQRPDLFGKSPLGEDAELMHREALAWLLERYQRVLDHGTAYGSILLDSRRRRGDSSKDVALRSRINAWRCEGRMGASADERLAMDNLLNSVRFEDSRDHIGLQMVDLVAGCTRRKVWSDDGHARRWFAMIEPRFARHPVLGDIDGTGLVVWPRSQKQRAKPQNDRTAFER